jgi:HAD superfamily hydrolase (TIGR01509 family)
MIRWVFLDIGNVLFNDDPQTYFIHRRYHQAAQARRPEFTFQQFLLDREAEVQRGNRWPTQTVMLRFLSPAELEALYRSVTDELRGAYDEVNFPMPHMQTMLQALARNYRLGVIANQVVECRGSLERRGILHCFDVVAISEECGLHKPDPALYLRALESVGAQPKECVMVGDRHDNDIVPATALGMNTVWVRWRTLAGKGWDPVEQDALHFIASHEREPFYGRVTEPAVAPSAEVADLLGVSAAIDQFQDCRGRDFRFQFLPIT